MSISVRCSDCDATFRVADEKAGKKVRCRECGAIVVADDDGEPYPARRTAGNRARKSSRSTQQPPWLLIAGVCAAVFGLVLFVAFAARSLSRPSRPWAGDPAVVAGLDTEVNLNGYAIRPPRGWAVSYTETGGVTPTVTYLWRSPDQQDTLTLEFRQDPRYHPQFEPVVITRPGVNQPRQHVALNQRRDRQRSKPPSRDGRSAQTTTQQPDDSLFHPRR